MGRPQSVQAALKCEFQHFVPQLSWVVALTEPRTSPTAYNAYSFFQYYTNLANNDGSGGCVTVVNNSTRTLSPLDVPTIALSTTVYQVVTGGALDATNLATLSLGDFGYQTFPAEFHQYILSNSDLIASYPFLENCTRNRRALIPTAQVTVSSLTTSTYNTVTRSGRFTASSAVPGSTMTAPAAPSTATTPASSSTTTTPKQADSSSSSNAPVEISISSPVSRSSSVVSNTLGIPANPSNGPQQSQPAISNPANDVSHSSAPPGLQNVSSSSSVPLNPPDTASRGTNPPAVVIEGQSLTADLASNYHIGTQTLIPGGPPITVNNVHYSLAPSATALISDGSTVAIPSPSIGSLDARPSIITIGHQGHTANSASQYVVGTQTLAPGGQAITVNNVPYSLAPSATALISGSSTIALALGPSHVLPEITIGGITYTADSVSQYIIETQTLIPGASAITVAGIPYSLAPSASALISGSVTVPLASGPLRTLPPVTIDGTTYTANSASQYIVGTQTLIPNGGSITANSTPYAVSLGPSAEGLIVGTSISLVPTASYPTRQPPSYVISGQTLTPGSEITVGGTKISLGAQGTDVVVGGTTEAVGVGGIIMSAFGPGPTAPNGNGSNGVVQFTGKASGKRTPGTWVICRRVIFGFLIWMPLSWLNLG